MKNVKTRLTLVLISVLFLSSVKIFAADKNIIFFAESFENVPEKVVTKMERCNKFCLSAPFDPAKYINKNVARLITARKIEPTIKVSEPYFPLISTEIVLSSSTILNKTEDFEQFLQKYKDTYRSTFEKNKHGIFLKGAALDDNILSEFYRYNILWTTAKAENEKIKGVFFRNGVALFVSYYDIPNNNANMRSFFSSLAVGYTPIILTEAQIKNEWFMLNLISYIEDTKNIDAVLPIDAAYHLYGTQRYKTCDIAAITDVPTENKLKLYLADEELKNCTVSPEVYQILYDEVANMCSYDVINGINTGDKNAEKLFDISYNNVFRVLDKKLPNLKDYEDVFVYNSASNGNSTENEVCRFTKILDTAIRINNSGECFTAFTVRNGGKSVIFETNINTERADYYDIYIDMNVLAYAGEQKCIKPLNVFMVPEHSWEYAIRVSPETTSVYKFVANRVELIKTFDTVSRTKISIPSDILRGNPFNWYYQVVAVKDGEPVDFIGTASDKEKLFRVSPLQIDMFNYKN